MEQLKVLRKKAAMTQAEIATRIGVDRSTYAKYENGHRPLPIDRLKELCLYYKVSADYILGTGEGTPK